MFAFGVCCLFRTFRFVVRKGLVFRGWLGLHNSILGCWVLLRLLFLCLLVVVYAYVVLLWRVEMGFSLLVLEASC